MTARTPQPNFENCSQAELQTALGAAATGRERDRMRALLALGQGYDQATVAGIFDVHARTLTRWILAFNERGIDGLIDAPRSGAPPKIPRRQSVEILNLLEHPEQAAVTHWTGKKFHGHLREHLGIEVGYSTLMAWIADHDFRLKIPQPWPDRQDEAQRTAFVEWLCAQILDPQVELWFTDECGIEGDPRPRRRFARKGSKPRVTKNGDHIRMNVAGMVCPRTGQFFALQMSHSDRECFQAFLNEANKEPSTERPRQMLIMDNASWHKCKEIDWGRFEPVYLPAYSPDLNPIERLWQLLKANWFADFVAKTRDQLMARLDQALLWVIDRRNDNILTCKPKTEL